MTRPAVAVDIGRSGARATVRAPDGSLPHSVTTGRGAGLGDPGGVVAAAAVVGEALRGTAATSTGCDLAVGVPGALSHPAAAAELADMLLRDALRPRSVVVASDVVAWHAGAFGLEVGTTSRVLLAAGTGAVALGVSAGQDGRPVVRRIDGHGFLLGDAGGGAHLGGAGLRAALRAREGAGPSTTLATAADALLADPARRPATAAELAAFAPAVLDAADDGDGVALRLVADAVGELASTIDAATDTTPSDVVVVGGLADRLRSRLRAARPDRIWTQPAGSATDGLLLLLDDARSAHENGLVRRTAAGAPSGLDRLLTEGVLPGTEDLDAQPVDVLVARLLAGQAGAPAAVAAASAALGRAADLLSAAFAGGGRLIYAGAGTSGRLAVQDAAELTPTFGLEPARAFALLAGGAEAAGRAVEGAEDDTEAGGAAIAAVGVTSADVVVGVAASGRTPYVRGVLAAAADRSARTVAVVNVSGGPLADLADVAIELITGPEVLAGSTRLSAGTAQKIALNTLTTAALVRAGGAYGPWMVGMRVTNAKLRRRAVRIVRDAAGVSEDTAAEALASADDEVSTALVLLLAGVDAPEARRRLVMAGSVRAAVRAGG